MSPIRKISDRIYKLTYLLNYLGRFVLLGLTFLVTVDVTGRYVFNKPVEGASEASEILMCYVVFLAFAYTLVLDKHIRVTLVYSRLPSAVQFGARLFSDILGLFLCSMLTVWSWRQFWKSLEVREIFWVIPLPLYVAKLAMPIGMLFISLIFLLNILQCRRPARPTKEDVSSIS